VITRSKNQFVLFCLFITSINSFAQEFYLNNSGEISGIYKTIPSNWTELNINESYDFLRGQGFENIKAEQDGDVKYISGTFSKQNYFLKRTIRFKKKLVDAYVDIIQFPQMCLPCFDKESLLAVEGNPYMTNKINENILNDELKDKQMKEKVINEYHKYCKKDGLYSMTGNVSSDLYDVKKTGKSSIYKTIRTCKVELQDDRIYDFTLSKTVLFIEKDYLIQGLNLKTFNTYDLEGMINIFLSDCKLKGLIVSKNVVDARFESLQNGVLGVSFGKDNDTLIKLRIDPRNWAEASAPKRWYLIYHELGHDILNLEHGNGGKMMFNFADKGYSWSEFWEDKSYMLNNYLK
jgi:hypothetical protein